MYYFILFQLLLIFTVSLIQPLIHFSVLFVSITLDTFHPLAIPCRQRQVSSNIPDGSKRDIKRQILKILSTQTTGNSEPVSKTVNGSLFSSEYALQQGQLSVCIWSSLAASCQGCESVSWCVLYSHTHNNIKMGSLANFPTWCLIFWHYPQT